MPATYQQLMKSLLVVLTICFCSVLAAADVTVRLLQGDVLQGKLVALTEKGITLQTATGERTLDAVSLHSVKLQTGHPAATETPGGIMLELVDDSVFSAASFSLSDGKATVKDLDGREFALAPQLIRSVRFRKQDESLRRKWDEIVGGAHPGDVLIVRKTEQPSADSVQPGAVVLDQLDGVVRDVRENAVVFEFEGDSLDVPRTKLEGILFRHHPSSELPEAVCRVRDTTGGMWKVRSLLWHDNQLQITTVAGAEREIAAGRLLEVDFSAANVVYLSELDPESVEWRPYFQSPATPPSLTKWFQPKRDQDLGGSPLTLAGESFEKGLALHSRTLLSYRLTRKFRRLVATVGVDDRFRATANLLLVISGDDRTLLTRSIKGNDAPFELDLDIQNVRRLKILVDFGDDRSDVGDLVYLCNARLVK